MGVEEGNSAEDAIRLFEEALILHRNGKYYNAIKYYEKAVQIDSKIISAWYNMGIAYQELGEYNDAIDVYNIILIIEPEFVDAWYCLAVALYKIGKKNESLYAYNKALELEPDITSTFSNNIRFRFLRLYEENPLIKRSIRSHFQFMDGVFEIDNLKYCPICGNNYRKRIVEQSIIKEYCVNCGYEFIVGRAFLTFEPSVVSEHWDGVKDNIENILENHYEKGKR